ncbi:nac domain [Musa troglodytarum]|uniref:Nac domain n=1 Tax=Musa troglodytarum TaxID=320322 RepID=A0A9E7I0E5_9LILI|nr:nac domain [Musa troglodytarum]
MNWNPPAAPPPPPPPPPLPPGIRFDPTGNELVQHFLRHKVLGLPFNEEAITEMDIYQFHPDHLPSKASTPSSLLLETVLESRPLSSIMFHLMVLVWFLDQKSSHLHWEYRVQFSWRVRTGGTRTSSCEGHRPSRRGGCDLRRMATGTKWG